MGASYLKSGVNIDAGNALVERIKPIARATARVGANTELGGFGGLFDLAACKYRDPVLVSATDGVGTKLHVACEVGHHQTIGIDLVAMCVNDLVVQGAEPLFFLDYFATGHLNNEVAEQVIAGIGEGCKQAGAALLGGETAEMPGMYQKGHYDLAGFAVGAVERQSVLPRMDIHEGDVVLGIASTGLHSNGFSLVRQLIEQEQLSYGNAAPFSPQCSLGEALLVPTRIYVKPCLAVASQVKAFAHITGGGLLENIPRILPSDKAVQLQGTAWTVPLVFQWLQRVGNIEPDECLRTFNSGIGMVVIVQKDLKENVINMLAKHGEVVYSLGEVVSRTGSAVVFVDKKALYGR